MTFFLRFRSKLAFEEVPYRTDCQGSKICCRNVHLHRSF